MRARSASRKFLMSWSVKWGISSIIWIQEQDIIEPIMRVRSASWKLLIYWPATVYFKHHLNSGRGFHLTDNASRSASWKFLIFWSIKWGISSIIWIQKHDIIEPIRGARAENFWSRPTDLKKGHFKHHLNSGTYYKWTDNASAKREQKIFDLLICKNGHFKHYFYYNLYCFIDVKANFILGFILFLYFFQNYWGGKKVCLPPQYFHWGGDRPPCPPRIDASVF